jgi:hypothetical protein
MFNGQEMNVPVCVAFLRTALGLPHIDLQLYSGGASTIDQGAISGGASTIDQGA